MTRTLGASLALALSLTAMHAHAQTADAKTSARNLGVEGQKALLARDFGTSEDRFQRAIAIFEEAKAAVPPTLRVGLARAHAGQGHSLAAYDAYNQVITDGVPAGSPPVFETALADAKKEIGVVSANLGWATLNVSGCDFVRAYVDGREIASAALGTKKAFEPGVHILRGSAAGCGEREKTFKVEIGTNVDVAVTLAQMPSAVVPPPVAAPAVVAPPSPPLVAVHPHAIANSTKRPFPYKTVAYISFGVGAAGAIVGGIFGASAISQHNDLKANCANGSCPRGFAEDINTYERTGAISTAGVIVAGFGAITGVVALTLASKAEHPAVAVQPVVGPGTIGMIGRF